MREAKVLQVAAVLVAAPRFMGAFASAIGIMIVDYYSWFAHVEIFSGAAMALLEGWAIAFVFRQWRDMPAKSLQWCVLLGLQVALMLALPVVAAPYLVSSQLSEPVTAIVPRYVLWLWSLLVAGIAPLVLAAVGYANAKPAQIRTKSKPKAVAVAQEPAVEAVVCEQCGKEFDNQNGLNAHRRFCRVSVNGRGERVEA